MTRATVVAPMLETVVSVRGTSTSDQAGYLWFQGIMFAHSTFMRPSQFCDAQAGQYQTSPWADYGSHGIYLDEQTSGYTIAHNAMVNAPANVAQNRTGTNTITDTPAANPQSVNAMAGIEAGYADIKNLTIPIPSF